MVQSEYNKSAKASVGIIFWFGRMLGEIVNWATSMHTLMHNNRAGRQPTTTLLLFLGLGSVMNKIYNTKHRNRHQVQTMPYILLIYSTELYNFLLLLYFSIGKKID